ncbi:MAG: FAD-binding oxidoreductase [Clostridiales Family XIII bacterium]|jgi:sarcosine oxidase subunit beta|nr:FAD-binding oxidoreductase [Clostridiales Family XIII bacterium]
MSNKSDVIIIGGGIIGCATAYYLSKRNLTVTVLEKKIIGEGGSSRNGGGVRQSGRDPRELPLAMYAVEHLWPNLSEELGSNVEYYKKGNLRLGKTEAHRTILDGLTKRAQAVGLDVEMIDYDEIKKINPYISDEVQCASWCPTDGHANPLLATLAFYKAARKNGVCFITGEDVTGIRKYKGAARYVDTSENTYEADTIVVAAGYESRAILNTLGLDVPMNRMLHEALVTEVQPKMFEQMLGTAEADFYGHQSEHGSFVFGGTDLLDEFTAEGSRPVTNSLKAPSACRGIIKYFPNLKDTKVVRTWAGFMDITLDHVPVIDKADEVPGLVVACGFSGHGFGISPAVGLAISELIVDGESSIDISGLRYGRFKTAA